LRTCINLVLLVWFVVLSASTSRLLAEVDWLCSGRAETTETNTEEAEAAMILTVPNSPRRGIRQGLAFTPPQIHSHQSRHASFRPLAAHPFHSVGSLDAIRMNC
jgi:hypothetical protein